jgi:hypothetical protein
MTDFKYRAEILVNLESMGLRAKVCAGNWERYDKFVEKDALSDLENIRKAWKFINAGYEPQEILNTLYDRLSFSVGFRNEVGRMLEILNGDSLNWVFGEGGYLTCVF